MARFEPALVALACGVAPCPGAAAGEAPAETCLALSADIAPGEFLGSGQVQTVPCAGDAPALPLVYHRKAGAPFATAALPAGTYLGPLALARGQVFPAGETLRIAYRNGPVAIEREVRLMAPARPGERALVRAEDGTVLVLPFVAAPAGGNRP